MKCRVHFNNNKYITMYDLNYTDFFTFLQSKPKIKEQLEKYMKLDIQNQENIIINHSITNIWKKNLLLKNVRFCILIYKNNYIGSFRYIKQKYDNIFGINLHSKIYIKIMIVYIIPNYRKLGLAYKMLNKIINDKNNYLLIVDNNNEQAISLYNKLNFKILGIVDDISILVKLSYN